MSLLVDNIDSISILSNSSLDKYYIDHFYYSSLQKSMTSRMMQRMSFGLYTDKRRVEFMKLRGPKGKGHAQMAVSRVKGSGSETPRVEHFPIADFENHQVRVCVEVS